MVEYNPCAESGCIGACCREALIVVTTDELRRCFPTAKVGIGWGRNGTRFDTHGKDKDGNTMWKVAISRSCPNLSSEGRCLIYNNRPKACENYMMRGAKCLQKRAKYDIGVPEEWIRLSLHV